MSSHPPKIPIIPGFILKQMYVFSLREAYVGDVEEAYASFRSQKGSTAAWVWVWIQAVRTLPVFLASYFKWSLAMFGNYLKIALRSMLKKKAFSVINIAGLAMGLAVSVLILLYVINELTYDRCHEKSGNV